MREEHISELHSKSNGVHIKEIMTYSLLKSCQYKVVIEILILDIEQIFDCIKTVMIKRALIEELERHLKVQTLTMTMNNTTVTGKTREGELEKKNLIDIYL